MASLFAAYILTYSCGISAEDFTYNAQTPKIITSIAQYHLYYHMKRFIRQPSKMRRFVTRQMETIILNNKPVVYEWTKEFHYGREALPWWVNQQPKRTVRHVLLSCNARVVISKNHTGQIGISYEKRQANY